MIDESHSSVPQTKHDRRTRRAFTAFARFVYRTFNRHAARIDRLETQLRVLRDELDELRGLPTAHNELLDRF
jgi:hypothetical protein